MLGYSHRGFAERLSRQDLKREWDMNESPCFAAIGGVLLGAIAVGVVLAAGLGEMQTR